MSKQSKTEELYQQNLRALRENPPITTEPSAGPTHPDAVFGGILNMGERARQNGTIALSVRTRKNKSAP